MNRRLAHEMSRIGSGSWEVTTAAPRYFHGWQDLRANSLQTLPDEPCQLVPLSAYLTRWIHGFCYGSKLRSLLGEGWDLVHCWEEPYILAGGQVAWWARSDTRLVYRTAQSIAKRYPAPFRWIERYAMNRAAGWVCSGQTVAQTLCRREGYSQRPMCRIPLGVDIERFNPDAEKGRQIRLKLGWEDGGPPVVGYLGRFAPEKGLTLLTHVLDGLQTPWRALFVGAGVLEPDLRSWAKNHGSRVRLCTDVGHSAVPEYLNAMDVLCVPSQTTPSWKEQFGRMLVEAFASGVPVVGSDSGEIPHVIGDAGRVVGEKDEEGWRRALDELLEDAPRRRELAGRGLQQAHGQYAWPIIARQYLDFFDQVLDRKAG
jgi:glycosyltransferase involved in cell wall biosynthesis